VTWNWAEAPGKNSGADPTRSAYRPRLFAASGTGSRPFTWTPAKIAGLVVVLVVVVATVAGLMRSGYSAGRDEARSRLAVEEYFDAIRRGDVVAGFTVGCQDEALPFAEWGMGETADALSAASLAESDVDISYHLDGRDGIRYHDFEIPRRARGTVVLQATDDERQWQVCGLLDSVDLWVPD
jgi:hypothetical protein